MQQRIASGNIIKQSNPSSKSAAKLSVAQGNSLRKITAAKIGDKLDLVISDFEGIEFHVISYSIYILNVYLFYSTTSKTLRFYSFWFHGL